MLNLGCLVVLLLIICQAQTSDIIIAYEDQADIIETESNVVTKSLKLSPNISYIVGLAADGQGRVFLSDVHDGRSSIFLVELSDKSMRRPITGNTSFQLIESLVFDATTDTLFFSDTKQRKVFRHHVDALEPEVVVTFNNDEKPRGLTIDYCNRYLYWGTWNLEHPTIERSLLDGSNRTVLVEEGLTRPHSLVMDPWDDRLYWIDVDSSNNYKIERGVGADRETVCSGFGHSPFDIAVTETDIFWSDWQNMVVWKASKRSTDKCEPTAVKRLHSTRPMGIATLNAPTFCLPSKSSSGKTTSYVPIETTPTAAVEPPTACLNHCFHGSCSVTSANIPVCFCDRGFAGPRCEHEICRNFCLNGGSCDATEDGEPICSCRDGFEGNRCQEKNNEAKELESEISILCAKEQVFLYGLIVTTCLLIIVVCLVVILGYKYLRLRRQGPLVVKRSTVRRFTGRSRSRETPKAKACCPESNAVEKIDLEDCCKMTICSTESNDWLLI